MAKKSENQRQSRLSNPVVSTKMYEALSQVSSMREADVGQILSVVDAVLRFVRNGEEIEVPMKKVETVPAELVVEPMPTRYSVRLGVKTPSQLEQYRMLEASVTVTSNDPDQSLEEARQQFVKAVVTACNTMGETPPDEIRPSVEEIFADSTPAIYGEGD